MPEYRSKKCKAAGADRPAVFYYIYRETKRFVYPVRHEFVSLKAGKTVKTIQKMSTKYKKHTINRK